MITEGLRQRCLEAGIAEENLCLAPDAVDWATFENLPDRATARQRLKIDNESNIQHVVYTGHLYAWKGIDTAVAACADLPNVRFHIVGGMVDDQEALRQRFPAWPANVILHGHQPPADVPLWLRSADLVLVPNSGTTAISREYTSPLKLYEAMASGTPLLVSDLPSLREAVDETTARLVAPDDVVAWRQAITESVTDSQASTRATLAQQCVAAQTWQARAGRIRDFMRSRS